MTGDYMYSLVELQFQSTPSSRRVTFLPRNYDMGKLISIHTLLAESDQGGADNGKDLCTISIHTLLAESDETGAGKTRTVMEISFHTLLAESD